MAAGWREWVRLPDFSPIQINAKLDTGARTSALHAFRLRRFERDGVRWVRFELHPRQRNRKDSATIEAVVFDERKVRSSNGREELRPVIRTRCQLGGRTWRIEITLTRRDNMSFRLLLGRTALRERVTVDSGRSYLLGGETGQ
ncbi:MAG: ATP-dependent zinc protease [Chloroflexi bacterium]|nr:ATP-dependent zinc protease [Chloroflexota bacterium]